MVIALKASILIAGENHPRCLYAFSIRASEGMSRKFCDVYTKTIFLTYYMGIWEASGSLRGFIRHDHQENGWLCLRLFFQAFQDVGVHPELPIRIIFLPLRPEFLPVFLAKIGDHILGKDHERDFAMFIQNNTFLKTKDFSNRICFGSLRFGTPRLL